MSAPTWTTPFHGVQHLNGLRQGFQITVEDLGACALTKVFLPGHNFNARQTTHDGVDAARAFGESQAAELDALS